MGLTVCETARLRVSHFSEDGDAAFILRLLNEPSFIRRMLQKLGLELGLVFGEMVRVQPGEDGICQLAITLRAA